MASTPTDPAALAASGSVGVEAIAGGIHAAFVVAAFLSMAAVVGALFVRTPEQDPAAGPPRTH